jgi:catechol 2,3-dioxygenase-like lactoylglutathione lyase family enzyme
VWTLGPGRHVYVEVLPAQAGASKVTLFVGDLDEFVAAAAGRGVEPVDRETYDDGVRKAVYRDPDGNEVGVGGAPA